VVNPQLVNLMGLAKSLAANLGLHRTPLCSIITKPRPEPVEDVLDSSITPRDASFTDFNSKSLEEWRAVAGVFFLGVV